MISLMRCEGSLVECELIEKTCESDTYKLCESLIFFLGGSSPLRLWPVDILGEGWFQSCENTILELLVLDVMELQSMSMHGRCDRHAQARNAGKTNRIALDKTGIINLQATSHHHHYLILCLGGRLRRHTSQIVN